MLSNYLNGAIQDIQGLIELTKQDLDDIQQAKHEKLFNRVKDKNELIISFGARKALLDNELVLLTNSNKDKTLSEILNDDDTQKLERMKECLINLNTLNKQYAKSVVVVSEFYNSLLENMFPSELDGYKKSQSKPASFLKVRV